MVASPAKEYVQLLAGNEQATMALLACSVALRLDDPIAREIINIAAHSNGSTDNLLLLVKSLDCVWKQWDKTWCIMPDVRSALLEQFYDVVPDDVQLKLRDRLATYAEQKSAAFSPDGQVTAYRKRQAKLEAAYQRALIPEQSAYGLAQLVELWKNAPSPSAAQATTESVDYLADEMEGHFKRLSAQSLPVEILFFRGMAARARGDKDSQRRYFGEVWSRGRPGDIFAEAAHYYGLLERNLEIAERALNDSLAWNTSTSHKIIVKNSLGSRLSKSRNHSGDAEAAFNESIELDHDPVSQAKTLHSLGQLLAENRRRWGDAEKALRRSLEQRDNRLDRAKTLHSLGNLLAKNPKRWEEAEDVYGRSLALHDDKPFVLNSIGNLLSKDKARWGHAEAAYRKSLSLDKNDHSKAKTWHSLGNLLSKNQERWADAEDAYKKSIRLDNVPYSRGQTWHSLGKLLSQVPQRLKDANIAFGESFNLRDNSEDKALTLASWAELLSRFDSEEDREYALKLALKILALSRDNRQVREKCFRVLADIYEAQGEFIKARQALESLLKVMKRSEHAAEEAIKLRIANLRSRG